MSDRAYVIGLDVGTSGLKALLLDDRGECPGAVTKTYPLSTPKPLWSEQDPEDWWSAAQAAVPALLQAHGVSASAVQGIGLTGQMHGLVLVNSSGAVLRPGILWNDQRTADECAAIEAQVGPDQVRSITGKPMLTGFTAPKLKWVRDHEPDVWSQIDRFMLPKDFVRYRMTGEVFCDLADGSGTSLIDLASRDWSPVLLEALGLKASMLPTLAESTEVVATLSQTGADALGLPAGIPVVAGAGDQSAEAVGCGIARPGTVGIAIGTSGVVFAAMDRPPNDPSCALHGYCHASEDMWHVMGVMLSAGGSLQWYRNQLGRPEIDDAEARGVDPYDLLLADCADVRAGCNDLYFLPYLTGERSPHADPMARGAFLGLTTRHTKAHMTRAVLEGVAFGLCDSLQAARDLGIACDRVRVSGGGSRSPFWRQILADVFDAEVATVNVAHGAAFGAAMLATVGLGWHASPGAAADAIVRETSVTAPSDARSQYAESWSTYRALYPALAPMFRRMKA